MRNDDVAIIGVSALLPGAHGLDAVHDLLAAGRDRTGQPAEERLRENGFAAGPGYLPMGYLDRIDRFDHRFFGVPPAEAAWMDPHQRLILQLAHEALENACYAPQALRGSHTAVVLGSSRSDYEDLFEEEDPQQILGILAASLAARISYRHDFTGPALVLDTACSGSLVAVAHAVALLRSGAADLALAGGISVRPVPIREAGHVPVRGVESPEGRCRPFDEKATGAVGGEGGGIVVLKPLPAALADGDHVHAVLKGIAVNHNGYRMASMSAPSRAAQTEVITAAWRDAGVDPATVGYVECHGSATPLGDVVEVEALRQAFLDAGVTTPSCAIGSIKGNIGHLDNAAGVAGLVKVLLSVRRGVRYPTAHFETPNPLIDFGGPVQVNPAFGPWDAETPRRAGLSSFGLTGTNVHAVVEQPPEAAKPAPPDGTEHLVTVSAKTASALARYRDDLAEFAERSGHGVLAVGHAMNRGRDDHPFRIAVVAGEPAALATALRSAAVPDSPAADDPPVVLLFSGDGGVEPELWADLCAAWPVLGDEPLPDEPGPRLVAVHHALHRLARSLGLPDTHLVGSGAGNLSVRIARGELSLVDGLAAAADRPLGATLDPGRLAEAVRGFVRDGAVLVELGTGGVLSRTMRRLAPGLGCVELIAGAGRRAVLRQVAALYRLGVRLDWDRHYAGAVVPRIEAPTYPLESVRCWCRPPGSPSVETRVPGPPAAVSDVDTERRVAEVWARALGEDELGRESDYFALGGTSIAAITALRTMERDFGVELTFADLYGHPTVRAFAARIEAVRAERGPSADIPAITVLPRGGPLPLSAGQEQLWYLDRLNPGSALYNIPHDLRLSGPVDEAALAGAVQDLLDRHEVLRTCIPDDDGVPFTRLAEPGPRLVVHDLSGLPDAERNAHRLADEEAVRPFDLATGPLVRITLVRLAEADHVLLWTYHHIVFDGWSPTIFFRDFTELYQARLARRAPELPELPFQFADFAAWQRNRLSGETLERGLRFWRAELAGLPTAQLPLDRPRPAAQSFDGDLVEFTIAEPAAEAARTFSREHGVTTFVTMLALVDTLLHRWAGFTDVVVGVATSGRTHPATHDLMGYFNNLPPFRTRVEGSLSFTDLVRRCADTVAQVLDHEEIPLEKIVSAVCGPREPGRQPLFDVAYTYQNVPQDTAELGGLGCTRFSDTGNVAGIAPGTAKFDLTVGVIDQQDGPMDGYFEYATALFDRATADALARLLPGLLDAVLREPGRPLDALPAVDGEPVPATTPREPAVTAPSFVDSDSAARAERVLAAICADLLAAGPVSAKDNFFDLGGDSVLGVRVAARAAKVGVHFTPQQLLQCRTLGELARAAVVDGPAPAPVPPSAPELPCTIPPTPIMLSFLRRMPDDVGDFVDVHTVETTPGIDAAAIRTAIGHLLTLHEPLRYRLRRNELGARLEVADLTAADVFDTKVLPPLSDDEELGIVADDCLAMKAEMDPARGPLFRVRHYDRGRARGGLLVLLVNHFVFDNMSTVVVLDDLDVLLADRGPAPVPRPPRWREWAEHLRAMAASDELSGELTYWTATLRAGAAAVSNAASAGKSTSAGTIDGAPGDGITARTLDDPAVATLLSAGGAEGREAALCAVSCGLARWQGAPSAFVMTEGEATPNPFRLAGRGPSVGWFTTLHPLVLPVEPGTAARDCLPEIADRARSVPNDGVGYGMLRHLSPDSPGVAGLRALPEPEVLVLHGPSDTSAFDSGVRLLRTRWDLSVNLKRAVASWFPLVVTSAVRDGALRLAVAGGVGQERLDALADEILGAFTELP